MTALERIDTPTETIPDASSRPDQAGEAGAPCQAPEAVQAAEAGGAHAQDDADAQAGAAQDALREIATSLGLLLFHESQAGDDRASILGACKRLPKGIFLVSSNGNEFVVTQAGVQQVTARLT